MWVKKPSSPQKCRGRAASYAWISHTAPYSLKIWRNWKLCPRQRVGASRCLGCSPSAVPWGWPRRCVVPSHHIMGVLLWLCGTTGTAFFQHAWEIAVKTIEASGQNLCYIPVTPTAEAGGCSAQPRSHKTCTWGGFQGYWQDFPLGQGFYLQWMWFPSLETGAGGMWFSPLLLTGPFILLGNHCLTLQGIEDGKGISSAETMASAFMGEW